MNQNLNKKKVISDLKMSRMFSQNLDKAGVATLWFGHERGFVNSLQAVEVNGFVYMKLPCQKQEGSRLKTYNTRYDLYDPVDYVSFKVYDQPVFASVEF